MPNDEKWVPLRPEEINALKPGDEVVLKYVNPNEPSSDRQFVRGIVAEIDHEHGKHHFISPDWLACSEICKTFDSISRSRSLLRDLPPQEQYQVISTYEFQLRQLDWRNFKNLPEVLAR
jgi:hypothetical protein